LPGRRRACRADYPRLRRSGSRMPSGRPARVPAGRRFPWPARPGVIAGLACGQPERLGQGAGENAANPSSRSTSSSTRRLCTDLLASRIGFPAARRGHRCRVCARAARSATANGGSRCTVAALYRAS
jgi:hypothetical protein